MRNEHLGPGLHGPSLRWYTPKGILYWAVRSAFRFWVTGKPVWGRGDNATLLHDATVDHRGGPRERLTRARWRRLAWRWSCLGLPALLWTWSGWAVLTYLVLVLGLGSWYAWTHARPWWESRELRATHVLPAARVLARVTGTQFKRRDAARVVQLPPGFGSADTPGPVRVFLPDIEMSASMKARISSGVGTRLGLPDAQAHWVLAGVSRAYVELTPQALPPAGVTLAGLMDELRTGSIDEPVVGVANGRTVVRMDFRNDSPHTLGSAGSGAGKSTLYKFIAMQRLAHGAYAIILDFKKWSHLRWAGRLPAGRVVVEDRVPEIHALLCRVLDELLWRKSFGLEDEDELDRQPTLDVYVEEINTLMSLLVDYWKATVAEQKQAARTAVRRAKLAEDMDALDEAEEALARANGLPAVSPAIQALRYGVNLGREFHVHFHFIGQSMSAKAAGGRDTRESFRTRLLARWDRKTWKMLADGLDYVACPSGQVGLWAHVHGSEVEIVRVPLVQDADAVQYVLDGRVPDRPMFHGDAYVLDGECRPSIDRPLTLAEAVKHLPGRPSLDALRKRVQRAALAPVQAREGTASLYLLEDLEALFAS